MKRRSFLSLSALSAVPVVAGAADEGPDAAWWETIDSDALTFQAVSEEGNLVLRVELVRPPEDEVTQVMDEKGDHLHFAYKGKEMPMRFWPGESLLTRFDLTWDGKAIHIPERFWNDSVSRLHSPNIPLGDLFLFPLMTDHCSLGTSSSLSADGGTVLIEWERPEEGDGRSIIRWIVSKSGTVLRHRHCL
jgi:hypothetical protein